MLTPDWRGQIVLSGLSSRTDVLAKSSSEAICNLSAEHYWGTPGLHPPPSCTVCPGRATVYGEGGEVNMPCKFPIRGAQCRIP